MRKSVANTAADPTIKFSEFAIDGEKFRACYDFNALAEAEEVAKCNLLHGMAGLLVSTASATQLRGLLYAALRKAHPRMTIEQAGALIRIDTMPAIREALLIAYRDSMPEATEADPIPGGADPPENN